VGIERIEVEGQPKQKSSGCPISNPPQKNVEQYHIIFITMYIDIKSVTPILNLISITLEIVFTPWGDIKNMFPKLTVSL
jgi:hypothetical protein